jgi:hypothetical protein
MLLLPIVEESRPVPSLRLELSPVGEQRVWRGRRGTDKGGDGADEGGIEGWGVRREGVVGVRELVGVVAGVKGVRYGVEVTVGFLWEGAGEPVGWAGG